jgi:hypothetical protein
MCKWAAKARCRRDADCIETFRVGSGTILTTKKEKKRRREIVRELRHQAKEKLKAKLPISEVALQDLFDYVNAKLSSNGCDHTLTHTRIFLATRNLPVEEVIAWLGSCGGNCDCEVVANSEEAWNDLL